MKNRLFRKGIVIGIIFLFVGAGIIPSTVGIKKEKTTLPSIGSGGYIQDLIENASSGDIINIPSGVYYERIRINKSVSLIGEDKETTIIDGGGNGPIIIITTKKVTVSGFTIQNGYPGVYIRMNNRNTIEGNNFNGSGIYILASDFNIISGNNINSFNGTGIILKPFVVIPKSHIPSNFNIIKGNNISNNKRGISLYYSSSTFIIKNNFIDNEEDAYFVDSFPNRWRQNYWDRPRILPKLIFGEIDIDRFGDGDKWINWVNIDWRPAKEPYDI
jgi:nitrous oxidase accessory protein